MNDDLIKRLKSVRFDDDNCDGICEEAAAALAEAQAEVARLRGELGAFLGVWAFEYARRMGFPDGELHPQHYDRMVELGLRMVDFRRAALARPIADVERVARGEGE